MENLVAYGSALFDYGNLDLAYSTLKKAVSLDGTHEKALYYFGLVSGWVSISFFFSSPLDPSLRRSGNISSKGSSLADRQELLLYCSM